tara:strand:+ start:287 stop:475 length:189 start_codon:yes stop_codon:yes gene_type:complete
MLKDNSTPEFVQHFMFQLTHLDPVDATNITEAMHMAFAVRSRRKLNQDIDEFLNGIPVWPTA